MLGINPHDEPNMLIVDETEKNFKIITVATFENRHYRLVKETSDGFFNYDFTINLSYLSNGSVAILNVPYIPANFINANISNNTTPVPLNQNASGLTIDEGVYKLLYLSREDNKEIPAKIDLNQPYLVGSKVLYFIYYRLINSQIYYTGYFGNRFLEEQTIPELTINTANLYDEKIIDEKRYFFIKTTSTPNLHISTKKIAGTSPEVKTVTIVSPNGISVEMNLYGNTLLDNRFRVIGSFFKNNVAITSYTSIDEFDLVSTVPGLEIIAVVKASDPTKYIFTLRMNADTESVEFRIYPKA